MNQDMKNIMLVVGLGISLLASIFMAYGKVFRRKETIEEQSGSSERENQKEKEHRMKETRFAQVGAILLITGFSVQIAANVIFESQ
jgi:predicted RND superfamily exporter protein